MILLFAVIIVRFCFNAKETGEKIGSAAGRAAGVAVGSYEGITQGLDDGFHDGEEQALSAEDTKVAIANEMTTIGKLDVLVAQDQFVDSFREGKDYKALFVYKAQATFSVDLESAEISLDGNHFIIAIPKPECEFTIDENESEKLAEWQKYFWSGSAESGYIGYLNSMAQIKKKAASEMSNYGVLREQAEATARKQVEILVGSMTGNRYNIKVVFKGEKPENE